MKNGKWFEKIIEEFGERLKTLNTEHGETRDKVISLEEIVKILCGNVKTLENRIWLLVVGTGLGFIVSIFLLLLNLLVKK